MTSFIKTTVKISDDQTNIDKYRLAANITEYHIILYLTKDHYSKFMIIRIFFQIKIFQLNEIFLVEISL